MVGLYGAGSQKGFILRVLRHVAMFLRQGVAGMNAAVAPETAGKLSDSGH